MGKLYLDDYIVETNHDGQVTKLVDFTVLNGHIAPSVLASYEGNIYVGTIHALPTVADAAKVIQVSPAGKVAVFAEGLTNILGLVFDEQG